MNRTIGFEAAVAVVLVTAGLWLQRSGLPGNALVLTGMLLGSVSVLSRMNMPETRVLVKAQNKSADPG